MAISKHIAPLEKELKRIADPSVALEAKYAELKQLRDMARAAVAPVRRLPSELLLEVARHTMDPLDCTRSDSLQVKAEIWAMSDVCRTWRTSILSCVSLWNIIKLRYIPGKGSGSYSFRNPNSEHILDTILCRSGDMELELEFFFGRPTSWESDFDETITPSPAYSTLLPDVGVSTWQESEEEEKPEAVMTDENESISESEGDSDEAYSSDHNVQTQDTVSFISDRQGLESHEDRKIATMARLLLRKLMIHSSRWRIARLSIPCTFLPLLEPVRNKCSRLRYLSIWFLDKYYQALSLTTPPLTMFQDAPCLEGLSLHDVPPQIKVAFPWSQIRRYKDTGTSSLLSLQNFKLMPHVTDCSMQYHRSLMADDVTVDDEVDFREGSGSLANSNVQKLSLGKRRLLSVLTLPRLTDLTYHEVQDMGVTSEVDREISLPYAELFSFIDRSACNLTCLTLGGRTCLSTFTMDLLALTPNVVSLSLLSLKYLHGDLLLRLSRDRSDYGDTVTLLPRLQSLTLTFHHNETVHKRLLPLRPILEVARSCRKASPEVVRGAAYLLRYLSVYSDRASKSYSEPELVESFLDLQKEGMRLSFISDKKIFAQDTCPGLSLA